MSRTSARSRTLGGLLEARDEAATAEVLAALTHGITRASALLGVPRRTLSAWVRRYDFQRADGRAFGWQTWQSRQGAQNGHSEELAAHPQSTENTTGE